MKKEHIPSRTFVLGLGHSGLSAAVFLRSQRAEVLAWDDTPTVRERAEQKGIRVCARPEWSTDMCFLLSPGIPWSHPLVHEALANGCRPTSDIALFCELFPDFPKIGITGTNGKSTTCALIVHGLEKAGVPVVYAGNVIGAPLFGTSPHEQAPNTHYVLELSSYQLALGPSLALDAAALLNLSAHHLERHNSLEDYLREKARIFCQAPLGIIGTDHPLLAQLHAQLEVDHPERTLFSLCSHQGKECAENATKRIRCADLGFSYPGKNGECRTFPWPEGKDGFFQKEHNRHNLAIAQCLLEHWIGYSAPTSIWSSFSPLAHRQEIVGGSGGSEHAITYVNDSKATNPEAAAHALRTFAPKSPSEKLFWIAGGVVQEDSLSVLKATAGAVEHAFLIGAAQERFAIFLEALCIPFSCCTTLEHAFASAHHKATLFLTEAERAHNDAGKSERKRAHATILLSPGCPSFDHFRDFTHRGQVFCSLVEKHIASQKPGEALRCGGGE